MGLIEFRKKEDLQKKHTCISQAGFQNLGKPPVKCIGHPYETLSESIGVLHHGDVVNFWTFGRYALYDIVGYILKQTGPADVQMCTWAISTRAAEFLLTLKRKGQLRSFRLWIDPRVKVRNPVPMQIIHKNWEYAIAPVHAKVATISNDKWKISVFGSLNLTSNPQPERGCIMCVPEVFERDNNFINEIFKSNGTE